MFLLGVHVLLKNIVDGVTKINVSVNLFPPLLANTQEFSKTKIKVMNHISEPYLQKNSKLFDMTRQPLTILSFIKKVLRIDKQNKKSYLGFSPPCKFVTVIFYFSLNIHIKCLSSPNIKILTNERHLCYKWNYFTNVFWFI